MGPSRAPGGPKRGPGMPKDAQRGAKAPPEKPKGTKRLPQKALQEHFALPGAREKQATPTGCPNKI